MRPMSPTEEILEVHSNQLKSLSMKRDGLYQVSMSQKGQTNNFRATEARLQGCNTQVSDLVEKETTQGRQHLKHVLNIPYLKFF